MKEKLIQSTAGALNCWRKCEECRVISNTGNNDQTGVASYGQKPHPGQLNTQCAMYSACITALNWGLGPHEDQTAEMVLI